MAKSEAIPENKKPGPWAPGINSDLPRKFLPLSTVFRPENVSTTIEEAEELADFTGLKPQELAVFKPKRLIVHELLIRVMANFSVPDGKQYGDLGINFREIVHTIHDRYIKPEYGRIADKFGDLRRSVLERAEDELRATVFAPPANPAVDTKAGFLAQLFGRSSRTTNPSPSETTDERERRILKDWLEQAADASDSFNEILYRALADIAAAIQSKHGRIIGDANLLARLVQTRVCNGYGSQLIGNLIDPLIDQAVKQEGYRRLPVQAKPVILNVKGASAAGKSTLRPQQRKLTERLGLDWRDFALISPDIWRKYLLDYDTLGSATLYAGTLTGHEIEIIDRKLDLYMARKGEKGQIPHLLIDRFRFDSFAPHPDSETGGRLLTRFGDLVHLFFVITPPEATVERAWKRGLEFGRYKAVDDLLDHNVEAYTGMPPLFFTWALKTNRKVHFEFLDNSVKKGELPRTIAFGWNDEITILDIQPIINADRYRKININALSPGEVYQGVDPNPANNIKFLQECITNMRQVVFVDQKNGAPYLRVVNGHVDWSDPKLVRAAMRNPEINTALTAILGSEISSGEKNTDAPIIPSPAEAHTLGAWGPS